MKKDDTNDGNSLRSSSAVDVDAINESVFEDLTKNEDVGKSADSLNANVPPPMPPSFLAKEADVDIDMNNEPKQSENQKKTLQMDELKQKLAFRKKRFNYDNEVMSMGDNENEQENRSDQIQQNPTTKINPFLNSANPTNYFKDAADKEEGEIDDDMNESNKRYREDPRLPKCLGVFGLATILLGS